MRLFVSSLPHCCLGSPAHAHGRLSTCQYVWHAGGAGKACADWMCDGAPGPQNPGCDEVDAARLFGGAIGSLGLDDVASKVKRIYETRMSDHTEE